MINKKEEKERKKKEKVILSDYSTAPEPRICTCWPDTQTPYMYIECMFGSSIKAMATQLAHTYVYAQCTHTRYILLICWPFIAQYRLRNRKSTQKWRSRTSKNNILFVRHHDHHRWASSVIIGIIQAVHERRSPSHIENEYIDKK